MLSTVLGTAYLAAVGVMVYDVAQIKLWNDYEADIKALREIDYNYEKINKDELPLECMVLSRIVDERKGPEEVIFSKTLIEKKNEALNLFESKFRKNEMILCGDQSQKNSEKLYVNFSKCKTQFFALPTLRGNADIKETNLPGITGLYNKLFWNVAPKQLKDKYNVIEKGIKQNQNFFFVGKLTYNSQVNCYEVMQPKLVIGSVRLDFYDYLTHRRGLHSSRAAKSLKICLGITAAHFLCVQVPAYF